ncbi:hypothetical protein D8B26_005977 [Coccidioides posadasii str. Silveira]|uniref:Endoglucanase n=3 Tax=Coccidioides posadasii TaxID=199306 RepID=E9DI47_COCPS|nr:hypothetical protein CPC735_032420 [Coccidioides posadasii C735 delta SOWgp]EER27906.1 hypothetical protein CPC735_032420 [Coccidioides posadasii C735 delta SOWgp]EFW13843.1 endoglucanase [Coccidioides posadasii str. Silveira]KMM67877.1 hypothetical protein CPAG_04210 [Coccidioides posadasii RMSCC 3488]QVM11324.1 hypothetical protein D8B26_005977 [Coccidioides posadasii str. Silveira]|eukprot:XP_003070051.1 hypothetical protein CPC735_032420 [Coccidioides posadasii C735 delta SOWgp]
MYPFLVLVLVTTAFGHMEMTTPYALRSKFDPANKNGLIDYSNTSPLLASGENFPCKGYHLNGPWRSVATYSAGQSYTLELTGTATHGGGSCQISLSVDNGKSFKVIKSMMGGCPLTKRYDFRIPSSTPSGKALISWSWFNLIGNREMYMNCAQVEISNGSTNTLLFDTLPDMYVANVNRGCSTVEGRETVFNNPGVDVVYGGKVTPGSPPFPNC